MKEKILTLCLMVMMLVIGIIVLTGCGTKKEEEKGEVKKNEQQTSQSVDETLVKINGLEFHLNKEKMFKDIKYTIAEEFQEADHDRYIQYNYYQEDQTNLLFFRIFYYNNQGIDAAISDLGLDSSITFTDGKTNEIEYKYYASPRDDGGTIHFYFINNNGDTYVLNFVSKYDIKDFEDKVVKSIKL